MSADQAEDEGEGQEKPGPGPAPEAAPRDDVVVAGGAGRCPFCHAAIAPRATAFVACGACLARHHAGCWKESPRCAACGHAVGLRPPGPRSRAPVALAAALLLGGAAAVTVVLRREDPARLAAEGRAALDRGDAGTAEGLLSRALLLEGAPREAQAQALTERARARTTLGRPGDAADDLERAAALASTPAEQAELLALGGQRLLEHAQQRGADLEAARRALDAAEGLASKAVLLDDDGASGWVLLAMVRVGRGDTTKGAVDALLRAAKAAPGDARVKALREALGQQLFVAGVEQRDRGNHRQAIELFGTVLRLRPDLVEGYYYRGACYDALGDSKAAADDYARLIALDPKKSEPWHNRAVVRQRLGDDVGAIADFDEAIARDPKAYVSRFMRANLLYEQSEFKRALEDLEVVLAVAPTDAGSLGLRGVCRWRLADREGALADFDAALAVSPADRESRTQRGKLRRELGDLAGAAEDLAEGARLDPAHVGTWQALAEVRLDQKDWAGAKAAAEAILARQPRSDVGLFYRGAAHSGLGDEAAAEADYRATLEVSPAVPGALTNLGKILKRRGDAAGARQAFDRALRANPNFLDALRVRATMHVDAKRWAEALADYDRAAQVAPNDPRTAYDRGLTRYNAGDLAGAVEELDRCLTLAPDHASAWSARGLALLDLERFDEARRALERAGELGLDDLPLRYQRARARSRTGAFSGAEEDLTAFIDRSKDPDQVVVRYERALVRHRGGDQPGAKEDLDVAARRSKDVELITLRGWIAAAEGDLAAARGHLAEAASLRPDDPWGQLWLLGAGGQPLGLEALAAAETFPGALARFALGSLPEAELLALAGKEPVAAARRDRVAEAWCLIGFLAERRKDPAAARRAFQAVLDARGSPFAEQRAWARRRLVALKP